MLALFIPDKSKQTPSSLTESVQKSIRLTAQHVRGGRFQANQPILPFPVSQA